MKLDVRELVFCNSAPVSDEKPKYEYPWPAINSNQLVEKMANLNSN